jgi:acetyl esterase
VPVRVLRPEHPAGWLVWAHGGSWQRGSAADWHEACADLAARSCWTVVSVDYRLAPAHRYPAALDDVIAVLDGVRERAGGAPVAVGGDSAGAALAASAAVHARDTGRTLAAQVLAYPPLDPSCASASFDGDRFPRRDEMRRAWRCYAGSGTEQPVPGSERFRYLSALATPDHSGLAPAVLAVGALDPVRDDVRAYAELLEATGGTVAFREFPGVAHAAFLDRGPHGQQLRSWLAAEVSHA